MKEFNLEQAKQVANELGINFEEKGYTLNEFLEGLNVELEHGYVDSNTNVTNDDILITAKIAKAHLNENAMYYNEDVGLEAWEHQLDKVKGNTKGMKIVIVESEE